MYWILMVQTGGKSYTYDLWNILRNMLVDISIRSGRVGAVSDMELES